MTIVQNPDTAEFPAMPLAAIAETPIDHILSIERIGGLLAQLGRPRPSEFWGRKGENHG
jgi:two-component system, chemotaxis family, protein-glutamate methylesterase/glutaminase